MAVTTPASDFDLMQRVSSYDSKALEVLYNRYSPVLYTMIKKIVGDEKKAEDVLTDVFAIIWRNAGLFDFHSGGVYTWLITLAHNKAVDTIKRTRGSSMPEYTEQYERDVILPFISPQLDPLDLKTALTIKDGVETALNKLTDAQQYVIYLAYYEGLNQAEIAQRLNIPVATVKSKIKFALNNLRDNLLKGESNGG